MSRASFHRSLPFVDLLIRVSSVSVRGPIHLLPPRAAMVVLLALIAGLCRGAEPPTAARKARIDAIAGPIAAEHSWGSIAIGVITPEGGRVFSGYGRNQPEGAATNPRTLFQIGSVSKVFTCLLLAEAAERGELKLDDPASSRLPETLKLPLRGGKEITVAELATHTSGLPRLPPNLVLGLALGLIPAGDPYSTLDQNLLGQGVKLCLPGDAAEAKYAYSNLGMGLVGHAVCHVAGKDYDALLRERITTPLAMPDTTLTPSPEQQDRVAGAHNASGKPILCWKFATLEGAGGLYSTADDLLNFLAAQLRPDKPLLAPAIELALRPRKRIGKTLQIGLGWHITEREGRQIWWHNGATYGHTAYIAFTHEPDVAVCVLTNIGIDTTSGRSVADEIGLKVMKELLAPVGN
jgi:CubicO group peptidase (beta-lactamase class C family)